MNRILLALITVGFAFASQAQVLLSEDFQVFANSGDIPFVEEPDDAEPEDWLSVDLDNLPDANTRPQNWYGTTGVEYILVDPIPEDTNFVMGSSSWLDGFAPGNRNYLITPELDIQAGMTVLHFDVGVRQTPRYADGMRVVVSPDADMTDLEANFSDTLWTQAQMVEEVSWVVDYYPGIDYTGCSAGGGFDIESFCWFPATFGDGTGGTGYRHAEDHTVTAYLDSSDNVFVGLNEPHTLDLSMYAGQTIRIAFLHDSDDDNFITVDNIVVEMPTSVAEFDFADLVSFYPNPATERLNLNFSTLVQNSAIVNVYDANGREVLSEVFSGNNLYAFHTLDVRALEAGIYSIQVTIDNTTVVGDTFMKQ
ncbi:MAG: T9SS type A sorting domain-containing protein [Flavobacteriales bacterium]|nr:T9SS type A sorting domain-containing protein [Flavobacteriales bacterium]